MKLFGWTISNDVQDGIRLVGDLQRVHLEDGDLLILSVPGRLSPEQARLLKEGFESIIDLKHRSIKTVVLGDGMTVGVLGKSKA